MHGTPQAATMEEERKRVHVVFITTFAMGHLSPMVELAKAALALSSSLAVTVLTIPLFGFVPELSSFVSTSVPNLSFLHLQPITPPPSSTLSFQAAAFATIDLYAPVVKSILISMHVDAILVSFFCSSMIDVGIELGIPSYAFFPIGAAQLGLLLHMAIVDLVVSDDKKAIEDQWEITIPFPGLSKELPISSLPDAVVHGKDDVYNWFNQHGHRFQKSKAILVNDFAEMQPDVLASLGPVPPVYTVGPLLSPGQCPEDHECIRWLDLQPQGSVVLLCFGSMGSFQAAQVTEVAIGLERSGLRFLWVLRGCNGLPEGFEERTKGRGLVWKAFAPQAQILEHATVGGFVTHCGWNSCMEGVRSGVPMAAWPLYAEQHFNAHIAVEEIGVAIAVRADRKAGNWANAEEVERAVRELMGNGGAAAKGKVREMGEKARQAVANGGSSRRNLERVVLEWSTLP